MEFEFTGEIIYWRGPSPFHYVPVPAAGERRDQGGLLGGHLRVGRHPGARYSIGDTEWETSLFPKDGRYLVPVKDMVRKAEVLDLGDTVTVRLVLAGPR